MNTENPNGVPKELTELSREAVNKQLLINESIETANLRAQHFLRVFNGATMEAQIILDRAQALILSYEHVARALQGILNANKKVD